MHPVEDMNLPDNGDQPTGLVANVLAAPPLAKPKRPRKPKAEEATVPSEDPKPKGRIVVDSELIAMSESWECIAEMPTPVKRRVVDWLNRKVTQEENPAPPRGV